MPSTVPSHLDSLLTTYLSALDEYTTLRTKLSDALSSAFLALAQARFRAPSTVAHVGFGSVLADGGRRGRGARIGVEVLDSPSASAVAEGETGEDGTMTVWKRSIEDVHKSQKGAKEEKEGRTEEEGEEDEIPLIDPLRLFGFVPPSGLRESQGAFEEAVGISLRLIRAQRRLQGLEGEIEREKEGKGDHDEGIVTA